MNTPNSLNVPVSAEDHVQGPPDASVTLVEYGDFECPHCGAAHPIIKAIQGEFGDDLRFVYRHFPLIEVHPLAEPSAETSEFAAAHRRFWDIHDLIFENQDQLSLQFLVEVTNNLHLDTEDMARALQQRRFVQRVRRDVEGGLQSGVHGTPTFFINGERHTGSFEYEDLVVAIEQQLRPDRRRAS